MAPKTYEKRRRWKQRSDKVLEEAEKEKIEEEERGDFATRESERDDLRTKGGKIREKGTRTWNVKRE